MPCDTPPPPPHLEDMDMDDVIEDFEDFVYISPVNPNDDDDEDDIEAEGEHVQYTFEESILTFNGHKDSVFCCNYNKTGQLAVSGGQDDTAFVWDTATGAKKFECSGHTDSVIAAGFSPDSSYVATADMLGLVQAWNANTGEKVWSFEPGEIIWMDWLHQSNHLIVGTQDGSCWKWSIPGDEMSIYQTSGISTTAGCISFNDETVAVGYFDGSLKFWNINDGSVAGSITDSSKHEMSVTTIRYHPNNSLVLTGSEDGFAKLIKTSNYKVLWSINCCDAANHEHEDTSVESVVFSPSQSLFATGTLCGLLSIWDISTQTKRTTCDLERAIVKLICDDTSPLVYVGTTSGFITSYDMRSGEVVKRWRGHDEGILDLTLSPDHKNILSASDDRTCKIFER